MWCVEMPDGEVSGELDFAAAKKKLAETIDPYLGSVELKVYPEGEEDRAVGVKDRCELAAWIETVTPQTYTILVGRNESGGDDDVRGRPHRRDQPRGPGASSPVRREPDAIRRWSREGGGVDEVHTFSTLEALATAINELGRGVVVAVRMRGARRGAPAYWVGPVQPLAIIYARLRNFLIHGDDR